MRLYGSLLSPFVMRAVLAARMKGFDIPVVPPDGGSRTPAHLLLNPMGKVPVLVDADFVLPESAVIAEYLEEALDGPALLPDNTEERARARLLARVADTYLLQALTPLFLARENPDAVPAALESLRAALGYLEALRPLHGDWLAADEHSLADAAAMPMFFYIDVMEAQFGTAAMLADHPGLAAWWARAKLTEHGIRMMREMGDALPAFMAQQG
jgi:glutathione S-transferase